MDGECFGGDLALSTRPTIDWELAQIPQPPPVAPLTPAPRRQPPPRCLDDPRIACAVRLLEGIPAAPLGLDEVAEHVGLSPFHFQRYFQEVMGESPSAYLRRTRLDRAAMNLLMGAESVMSTALDAGYASHEAFIRAFQRRFGMVPTQYRQFAQARRPLPTPLQREQATCVRVQVLRPQPLLAMRFHGSYTDREEYWRVFGAYLQQIGFPLQGAQLFGISLDGSLVTPTEQIRYDCAVLDPGFDATGTALTGQALRAGRYATLRCEGAYLPGIVNTLSSVAMAWLPNSGERLLPINNGAFEVFHRPPWEKVGGQQSFTVALSLA
ncbi:AraC family transcriptional regulator [Ectopseudomonas mendocina]|uniref:AraC family transcriptional regulator n=1 Tax=Ectopseudomonas mendocina TaxID=300 RepID=A0A2R3QNH4_ECTME|nr:AraC family transcriptional regulator [Pseudomonas mendocina]